MEICNLPTHNVKYFPGETKGSGQQGNAGDGDLLFPNPPLEAFPKGKLEMAVSVADSQIKPHNLPIHNVEYYLGET